MFTEFLVKILGERAVICRGCFLFLLQLSDRTEDLHFRLYFVSNTLYKHHFHNNLLLKKEQKKQITKFYTVLARSEQHTLFKINCFYAHICTVSVLCH